MSVWSEPSLSGSPHSQFSQRPRSSQLGFAVLRVSAISRLPVKSMSADVLRRG